MGLDFQKGDRKSINNSESETWIKLWIGCPVTLDVGSMSNSMIRFSSNIRVIGVSQGWLSGVATSSQQ